MTSQSNVTNKEMKPSRIHGKQGKLIVICGIDGSGKSTQARLLVERLEKEGYATASVTFPRYHQTFFSELVIRYLNGEFGNAAEVNPYLASLLYAGDRWETKPLLERYLHEGKIIICDRYVSASLGHQMGKIKTKEEQKQFATWLETLEYTVFGIPRPDLTVFLHVPVAVAQELLQQRDDKEYIKNKRKDIHEADEKHLQNTEQAYLLCATTLPGWVTVTCTQKGKILNKQTVHEELWSILNTRVLSKKSQK
ncbi:thymidylate kinase [Candidatus Woesearchaeota archaeon]|nr:thymidylate kinase [Candidatus Woesearchaeota archaeon]